MSKYTNLANELRGYIPISRELATMAQNYNGTDTPDKTEMLEAAIKAAKKCDSLKKECKALKKEKKALKKELKRVKGAKNGQGVGVAIRVLELDELPHVSDAIKPPNCDEEDRDL